MCPNRTERQRFRPERDRPLAEARWAVARADDHQRLEATVVHLLYCSPNSSPMTMWKVPLCALVLNIGIVYSVRGHAVAINSARAESEEDHLATEVEDPTAILTQIQLQDIYTPGNFQTSAQTNTIQIRPIVPIEVFHFSKSFAPRSKSPRSQHHLAVRR
jgi:hypothetical protein